MSADSSIIEETGWCWRLFVGAPPYQRVSVGAVMSREIPLQSMPDFDWPTRVARVTLTSGLRCARSTTKVIQPNSDDRDHGDKPLM